MNSLLCVTEYNRVKTEALRLLCPTNEGPNFQAYVDITKTVSIVSVYFSIGCLPRECQNTF